MRWAMGNGAAVLGKTRVKEKRPPSTKTSVKKGVDLRMVREMVRTQFQEAASKGEELNALRESLRSQFHDPECLSVIEEEYKAAGGRDNEKAAERSGQGETPASGGKDGFPRGAPKEGKVVNTEEGQKGQNEGVPPQEAYAPKEGPRPGEGPTDKKAKEGESDKSSQVEQDHRKKVVGPKRLKVAQKVIRSQRAKKGLRTMAGLAPGSQSLCAYPLL